MLIYDDDVCRRLSCPLEGGGSGGGEGRYGRSKKGRIEINSDAKRELSHRSNSVKAVGCEEQEKTWTVHGVGY